MLRPSFFPRSQRVVFYLLRNESRFKVLRFSRSGGSCAARILTLNQKRRRTYFASPSVLRWTSLSLYLLPLFRFADHSVSCVLHVWLVFRDRRRFALGTVVQCDGPACSQIESMLILRLPLRACSASRYYRIFVGSRHFRYPFRTPIIKPRTSST